MTIQAVNETALQEEDDGPLLSQFNPSSEHLPWMLSFPQMPSFHHKEAWFRSLGAEPWPMQNFELTDCVQGASSEDIGQPKMLAFHWLYNLLLPNICNSDLQVFKMIS